MAIAVLLLGVYAASLLLARGLTVTNMPGSVFSEADDGLKVYFDYLDALGYDPRVIRSFDELPDRAATIVFVSEQAPEKEPTQAELERLGTWVERGGRLVVAGRFGGDLLGGMDVGGSARQSGEEASSLRPLVPSALTDRVREVRLGGGRLLTEGPEWVTHLKDLDGQGMVSASVGRGEVVWLADSFPLTNEGMGKADNARLATALAASGRVAGAIHFDEYHHGDVRGGGVVERLRPGGRSALVLAIVGAGLALVGWGRRVGPPVPPPPEYPARGSGYIESLAALYRKAGAREAALEDLEDGLRRALARRHGTVQAGLARRQDARDALERSRAVREAGADRDAFLRAAAAIRTARNELEGIDG